MQIKINRPLAVFAAGLVLVGASSIGATRAAATYQTNVKDVVDFSASKMEVDLQEGFFNEETNKYDAYESVSDRELYLPAIETFNIGPKYTENLRVVNTSPGGYSEYVRVIVNKSWYNNAKTKGVAGKDTSLDPNYIVVGVADASKWIVVDENKDDEDVTYYYTQPLEAGEAADLINSIQISNDVWKQLEVVMPRDSENKPIKNLLEDNYKYNDKSIMVNVQVDAVQAHNGHDAMLGAWGVNAVINDSGVIESIDGVKAQ